MRIHAAPAIANRDADLSIVLYGQSENDLDGSAGAAIKAAFLRSHLQPTQRAWDFLSIALAVTTADFVQLRRRSPDGWTRQFEISVAVAEPAFWSTQAREIESALQFLTTDTWKLAFVEGGYQPAQAEPAELKGDSVLLLSGGLDSLVGLIDLVSEGRHPVAMSKTVRGDKSNQADFARRVRNVPHFALNPNPLVPGDREDSQRARSFVFIALATLVATALSTYATGPEVTMYLCENGFIAINPPLSANRVGSLSTRTAHPEYLRLLQQIMFAADLRVRIVNPYLRHTKGEMLKGCHDQKMLKQLAQQSTSCGRFQRYGYTQCGRCVPCQVRRAALVAWQGADRTGYYYEDFERDSLFAYDDVRAVAMAIAQVQSEGLDSWIGSALANIPSADRQGIRSMLERGLQELERLHRIYKVR